MKNDYISPLATEVYIETEALLDGSLEIKDTEVDSSGQLSTGRRGEWGNLWAK